MEDTNRDDDVRLQAVLSVLMDYMPSMTLARMLAAAVLDAIDACEQK